MKAVGDGDVLLRVRAAGVDPGVSHLMTGLPYLMRIMGFGLLKPKVRVRGRAVAGREEAVGEKVAGFRPGDEVFVTCEGSFAEYACARLDRLGPKPSNLSFEQAAAVPISAQTALQGPRDGASGARLRAGERSSSSEGKREGGYWEASIEALTAPPYCRYSWARRSDR